MTTENNICYYSKGTKHELCPHQNWCIFNPERIKLEETINKLSDFMEFLYPNLEWDDEVT